MAVSPSQPIVCETQYIDVIICDNNGPVDCITNVCNAGYDLSRFCSSKSSILLNNLHLLLLFSFFQIVNIS